MDDSTDLGSIDAELRELASAPAELLVRGTLIDEQYAIEHVIGEGAMGVVYLARDLRLERNVAVKLARERSPVALARASREAVLLARLSHPNVVVVHQVGALDGRVYVAMEHVAGSTARAWCKTHAVGEILALYVAVGEGLAAAHAAGLVHRDFKPDNVLVGDDGRGRVADFGLAISGPSEDVAGTPAYMAPEQQRGDDVDARADQFAFCASLLEALDGRRIPRHIDAALGRGMAASRDARWPALPPLLAELRRDPARRPRRIALGVAVPAIAIGALALAKWTAQPPPRVDPCAAGGPRMTALWTPARGASVRAAVAPAGSPAWRVVVANAAVGATETWTARWTGSYRSVCEAGWSPALHDRGMECLARGEHALGATVDSLVDSSVAPDRLDELLARLPRPESRADPVYLAAIVPPPTDPALAHAVSDAQDQLQRVQVLTAAGQLERANALLGELEQRPALGYAPFAAQLHFARATSDRVAADDAKAVAALSDAYFEARAAGDRVTAAQAASEATVALIDTSHDADAAVWARLAEVEVASIADPGLQVNVLRALSIVETSRNAPERGVELADRAVRLARGIGNVHGVESTLQVRSQAYDALGTYDRAIADLDEAARLLRASYGDVHPDLSEIDQQRALVLVNLGRATDAIAAAREALAIAEATSAADGPSVLHAVGTLGMALGQAHQLPEALTQLNRSIALTRKAEGERTYNVASDLNNRCDLLTQLGRIEEAIADCRLAASIWREVIGPDANEIGLAEYNTALAMIDAKRYADARTATDHAVAILGAHPDSPSLAIALTARATASRNLRDLAAARRDLEHAIALLAAATAGNPAWLADARLELARIEQLEGHAEAGRTLAIAARDAFATLHDDRENAAAQLIAELGAPP